MRNPKTLRIFILSVFILLSIVLCTGYMTGCSKKPAKSPPKSSQGEKKESKNLTKLQTEIEKLLKMYERDFFKQVAPIPGKEREQSGGNQQSQKQEAGGKQSQQQKSQQGQAGGSKQGQQSDTGGGQQAKASSQQKTEVPDWPKYEKTVTSIHSIWNGCQPETVKSGASLEMTQKFNQNLDKLTISITKQDLYQGLQLTNELYDKTIDFERLFITKLPPELKKVLYYMRKSTYFALNGQEEPALLAISEALNSWETVKTHVQDTNKSSQVENSLKELSEAVKQKDPNLIKIKAQIAEKNIKNIIKLFEQKKITLSA
ncbi:MAG TPA: hypothetical protein GX534_00750 [Thermoanaerobacterales bacterium]|jgi:hypothetical protein|nr:hypothetical protein [Thermoanaerobacterales bacterium]